MNTNFSRRRTARAGHRAPSPTSDQSEKFRDEGMPAPAARLGQCGQLPGSGQRLCVRGACFLVRDSGPGGTRARQPRANIKPHPSGGISPPRHAQIARKNCVGTGGDAKNDVPGAFGHSRRGAIGRERAPCSDGKNMGSEDRPQIREGVQHGDARAPVHEGRSRSAFASPLG